MKRKKKRRETTRRVIKAGKKTTHKDRYGRYIIYLGEEKKEREAREIAIEKTKPKQKVNMPSL